MSEKTISELFIDHRKDIFNSILKFTKDKDLAEDLTQDLFIKMVESEDKYIEKQKFLPYAIRCGHNLTCDYFRKNNRMKMLRDTDEYSVFDYVSLIEENIEDAIVKNQTLSETVLLINQLPLKQQEVIKKRFYEDESFKNISETNNESINTSLGRMRYALRNLRKQKNLNDETEQKKQTAIIKKYYLPTFYIPTEKYKYTLKMSETTENNVQGLRKHLFEAIRKLEGGTMKADEAKAMASLAQTIINSAKLELEYKSMVEKQPDIKMLNSNDEKTENKS